MPKGRTPTALVTGANSGIGLATATLLAQRGYAVTILGRRREPVEAVARRLSAEHIVIDMAEPDGFRRVAERFADRPLDALVNNAGVVRAVPFEAMSADDLAFHLATNLAGPLHLVQACLPALIRARGAVTNVTSAAVDNARPRMVPYAASKGALTAATLTLAIELASTGVRFNVVSPGAVETPMVRKLQPDAGQRRARRAHMDEHVIPMGRHAAPEEIAHVIVAQLESSYTTGAIWGCDGGVGAT